jgi:hypothetical protein
MPDYGAHNALRLWEIQGRGTTFMRTSSTVTNLDRGCSVLITSLDVI